VPVVVSCPNCEKRLAVKDELKGRALVCPQCKGRFSVPADDAQKDELLGVAEDPAATGGGMDFLHNLGPSSVGATKGNGQTSALAYSAQRPTIGRPAVSSSAAARTAGRVKKQADQKKLIGIGGGIAAAILIVIVASLAFNGAGGGGGEKAKEVEDIRFGLKESDRIQLFQRLVRAVDERGISKSCKDEWYRLADEYKLDRKNIKDLLEEGFSFKNSKWVLPEATSTAKNRAVRMDWIRERTNGPDPVLAL
jgi:uncharacterized protein YbaR (Trm112 family)